MADPIAAELPQHPHLARNGASSRHSDAAASGAAPWAGPLGLQPEVETAWFGLQDCATLAVDSRARLVALCSDRSGPSLHVIDPETMRKTAGKDLPEWVEGDETARNVCSTESFYLDERDRAVLATTDRQVLAVRTSDGAGEPELSTDESWDLKPYVAYGDCVVALLPDWSGRIWWVSHDGLVGTITPDSGQVACPRPGRGGRHLPGHRRVRRGLRRLRRGAAPSRRRARRRAAGDVADGVRPGQRAEVRPAQSRQRIVAGPARRRCRGDHRQRRSPDERGVPRSRHRRARSAGNRSSTTTPAPPAAPWCRSAPGSSSRTTTATPPR